LGIGPNPQSPIPNPQSPIRKIYNYFYQFILLLIKNKLKQKNLNYLNPNK